MAGTVVHSRDWPETLAIHVGCSPDVVASGRRAVQRARGSTFVLDLSDVATTEQLVSTFASVFQIPWPIGGINAVVSASDFGWIPGTRTHWVEVANWDHLAGDLLSDLIFALANIIDRMRSGGSNFAAAFTNSPRTDEILYLMEAENDKLKQFESDPHTNDTHPVPVIDHRSGLPRAVGRCYRVSSLRELTNAIHVGCSDSLLAAGERAADDDGHPVYRLDLTEVRTADEFLQRCIECFDVRRKVTELASLLPEREDRYIWEPRRRYLTLVTGIDTAPPAVLQPLAWLLTNGIDRIRLQGDRATALVTRSARTDDLVGILAAENQVLSDRGESTQADVYPVAVIDHRVDPAADD
jgi:hypothetical protein